MADLVEIGALWKVENRKDSSPILTGSMGNAKLLIFPNKYKQDGNNQPDFKLYVTKKEKKPEQGQSFQGNAPMGQQPPPPPPPQTDGDLPF